MQRRHFARMLGVSTLGSLLPKNLSARTRATSTFRLIGNGDPDYNRRLAALHNGAAAASEPAVILQPKSESDVRSAILLARKRGMKISVCSGSHSRYCALDKTLMLDFSKDYNKISVEGEEINVQAGVSMGQMVKALAPHGRVIPVGTHSTPGFGLLTMGGVGHLSRSLGLTIDAVEELRGFRADGEPFILNASGQDEEGWILARGAALFFAIVTDARLKSYPRSKLTVARSYEKPANLRELLALAESLPRDAACSFILGRPPMEDQWRVLTYAVTTNPGSIAKLPNTWTAEAGGLELLPPFELPAVDGAVPPPPAPVPDRHKRMRTWVYSTSIPKGRVGELAKILSDSLNASPNAYCQIDLQHVGGAVADVPPFATAYTGRTAEWSVVVTGVWEPTDLAMEEAARQWADHAFHALSTIACHYYIVQRHPGTASFPEELRLAYGPLLPRLRQRKASWDPYDLLPSPA